MRKIIRIALFIPFLKRRKNNPGEVVITGENGEQRVLRSTPDWTDSAINADHLWIPTSASGDLCYVPESECTVSLAFILLNSVSYCHDWFI